MAMNAYLQRRILGRMVLGFAATVFGFGFLAGFEAVAGHRPLSREFLYEPHAQAANPTPTPSRAAPPITDTFDFMVDLPGANLPASLKAGDFVGTDASGQTRYSVLRAERKTDVSTRAVDASPASVALLLDQSGSIQNGLPDLSGQRGAPSDPDNVRLSVCSAFADSVPDSMRLALFTFGELDDDSGPAGFARAAFGGSRQELKQAILERKGKAEGSTQTFSALLSVIGHMKSEPETADKAIICFTDGPADSGQQALIPQVIEAAKAEKIKIWFAALGNGDFTQDKAVAEASGGGLVSASNASKIGAAFARLTNKVVREERSHWNVTLRAMRTGDPFMRGELLKPTVSARAGTQAPSTFQISVEK